MQLFAFVLYRPKLAHFLVFPLPPLHALCVFLAYILLNAVEKGPMPGVAILLVPLAAATFCPLTHFAVTSEYLDISVVCQKCACLFLLLFEVATNVVLLL